MKFRIRTYLRGMCALAILISICGCGKKAPDDVRAGVWKGTSEYGEFDFIIGPQGRLITSIEFQFNTLKLSNKMVGWKDRYTPYMYTLQNRYGIDTSWHIDQDRKFDITTENSEYRTSVKALHVHGEFNRSNIEAGGSIKISTGSDTYMFTKWKATKYRELPGINAPKAESPDTKLHRRRLIPSPIPGWGGAVVKTICLKVREFYPLNKDGFSLHFEEVIRWILTEGGFRIVSESDSCDATLIFTLRAQAISANYTVFGTRFTGAKIDGNASFSSPGRKPLTVSINLSVEPPPVIDEQKANMTAVAERSPLLRLWSDAFVPGLAQLLGPENLIPALRGWNNELQVRPFKKDIVQELIKTGPELAPALMQAMRGDFSKHILYPLIRIIRQGVPANDVLPTLNYMLLRENRQPVEIGSVARVLAEIGPEAKSSVPALIYNLHLLIITQPDFHKQILAQSDRQNVDPYSVWAELSSDVIMALNHITGKNFGLDAYRWQLWWDEQNNIQPTINED